MSTKTDVQEKSDDPTEPHDLLATDRPEQRLTVSDGTIHPDKEASEHENAILREEALSARRDASVARREAASAQERSVASAEQLLEVEEVLAQSKARIFALEEAIEQRDERLGEMQQEVVEALHWRNHAEDVMSAMKASISWRITAPFRLLKRRRK